MYNSKEIQKTLIQVENKERIIEEKDCKIETLNNLLNEMQHDLREISGDFLFKCRDLRKTQYLAVLDNLEQEKNDLLNQLERANLRLNQERETIKNDQLMIERQKLKIGRLYARLRKERTLFMKVNLY